MLNGLVAAVSAQSPSPRPCERRSTSSEPRLLRSHFPRVRGDTRGSAHEGAMPGARLGRSGPLEARQVTPARRRSGAGPGAKQGRFSGFLISRFPRTQHAPTAYECDRIAPGKSGNLEAWEPGDLRRAPAHAHSGRSTGTNDPLRSVVLPKSGPSHISPNNWTTNRSRTPSPEAML